MKNGKYSMVNFFKTLSRKQWLKLQYSTDVYIILYLPYLGSSRKSIILYCSVVIGTFSDRPLSDEYTPISKY